MNKKFIVLVAVLIIATVGGYFFPLKGIIVGSVPGPNIDSQCLTVNGLTTCYNRTPVRTATTTLCSIKSPSATSTLVFAGATLTTTATYATEYEMGKASVYYSTTTSMARMVVAANAKLELVATSTSLTDWVIGPSSFINVKISTTTASATYSPAGYCSAVFQEM